jgi:undecaprenyl diphosphate synthase
MKSLEMNQQHKLLPDHIAILMDGNGRWAKRRGLVRHIGHEQGAKAAEDIIRYCNELGIKYITLYAFSTENWQRPQEEIDAVMKILERYLKEDAEELVKNDVKIAAIGDLARLPAYLRGALQKVMEKTAHCQKFVLTLALSYSAWEEIILACKNISQSALNKTIDINSIDEKVIKKHLYTHYLPDPDLFIRPGGEIRLSNFLLLQISYSELYFCPTLWPDFQRADLDLALLSFASRKRRFGTILPQ